MKSSAHSAHLGQMTSLGLWVRYSTVSYFPLGAFFCMIPYAGDALQLTPMTLDAYHFIHARVNDCQKPCHTFQLLDTYFIFVYFLFLKICHKTRGNKSYEVIMVLR